MEKRRSSRLSCAWTRRRKSPITSMEEFYSTCCGRCWSSSEIDWMTKGEDSGVKFAGALSFLFKRRDKGPSMKLQLNAWIITSGLFLTIGANGANGQTAAPGQKKTEERSAAKIP